MTLWEWVDLICLLIQTRSYRFLLLKIEDLGVVDLKYLAIFLLLFVQFPFRVPVLLLIV